MSQISTYIDIKDCIATPSSFFYAFQSTDSGNNSGWVFKTYVQSSPITGQVCNYVTVKDCLATPVSTFYGINSTDSGNNTNWTFRSVSELGTVYVEYVDIKDSNATGAYWSSPYNCGNNDISNNDGWMFYGKDFISFFAPNIPVN